jgi:predicted dithiol-disulfide oxidoreductase (DUF899 family)
MAHQWHVPRRRQRCRVRTFSGRRIDRTYFEVAVGRACRGTLMPIWTILDCTPEGRGTSWYCRPTC